MTVHKAVSLEDFEKIAEFLKKQPFDSLSLKCWKTYSMVTAEKLYKQRIERCLAYSEDGEGCIRAVVSLKYNMAKRRWTMPSCCLIEKDFVVSNNTFFNECVSWLLKHGYERYGFRFLDCHAIEKYHNLLKILCGDALKTRGKTEVGGFGTVYHLLVDLKKYVEGS